MLTLLASSLGRRELHAEEESEQHGVADRAQRVLQEFCFRCHRGKSSSAGGYTFDTKTVESMVDESVITPGEAEESEMYNAMFRGRMPPRNQVGLPRPSPEDVQAVKSWIEAGATQFRAIPRRPFISLSSVMEDILSHFQSLQTSERSQYRYFTLTNLWNDTNIDERQLRMTRAGLAKSLNSLSWQQQLVQPTSIDKFSTVYAVNIRRLGWTSEHWNALVHEYPYQIDEDSIGHENGGETPERFRQIKDDLIQLGGNDRQLKHLRADWFVTVGLQPKLYHKLLYELAIPSLQDRKDDRANAFNPKSMTDLDLERHIGVTVYENIFRNPTKARRAGFTESGVSSQNRLIERHPMPKRGYYWKSYDFLNSNPRAVLTEFPLGPHDNPTEEFSFLHDGGEIIFTLPNGLLGFLLTDAKGSRLNAGPIEIVGDALKTAGRQTIVNGLSCVACHRKGLVVPPDDIVRHSVTTFGVIDDKIKKLYPEPSIFQEIVAADIADYLSIASELLKPHLKAEDFEALGDHFPAEPIGEVARWYLLQPMNLETVASELYHPNVNSITTSIRLDDRARHLGIGQLKDKTGTLKREVWHHIEGRSLMQQAADVLGFAPAY